MDYHEASGAAFVVWGLLHVVVGAIAFAVFLGDGAAGLLPFVDLDPAATDQAVRTSHLVIQFYQALLLIGLTVTVLGWTLSRRGDPIGLGLNAVLVLGIDSFFLWFEVVPGHRPVAVGVLSVGLFVVGVGAGWLGLRQDASGDPGEPTGEPAG